MNTKEMVSGFICEREGGFVLTMHKRFLNVRTLLLDDRISPDCIVSNYDNVISYGKQFMDKVLVNAMYVRHPT